MNAVIVLLGVAAIAITIAETLVSTWAARADRQSTSATDDRFSRKAALWEGLFDALLIADMYLIVNESAWLGIPVVLATIGSKYWALERRRRKFRSRTKKPKRKRAQREENDSGPGTGSGPSERLSE